jgi:factor associated with neutral sphingomyelinase activation
VCLARRLDFAAVVQLEAESMQACVVGVNKVTKMKANMADEPYVVEKGATSTWVFSLTYAKLDAFMPLAQEQLVISRLPTAER